MKKLFKCVYPGCNGRFDPDLKGTYDDQPGQLTGWLFPDEAEKTDDTPTHDHLINLEVFVEVEE